MFLFHICHNLSLINSSRALFVSYGISHHAAWRSDPVYTLMNLSQTILFLLQFNEQEKIHFQFSLSSWISSWRSTFRIPSLHVLRIQQAATTKALTCLSFFVAAGDMLLYGTDLVTTFNRLRCFLWGRFYSIMQPHARWLLVTIAFKHCDTHFSSKDWEKICKIIYGRLKSLSD